ncbi:hypothetical protein [Pseudomonas viridiflava]|uniref:hypothetical protein n=1 Tax=Pseudomonas viridiflava TaxID=33069 RepID=UPI000F02B90D|nr:hypothetical protein [Pseudomonas viridiflava]
MKYTEYLSSAKRHNHACRVLKTKLESLDESELGSEEFKFLVLSIYYLSGYIVECSLKFKIFELSNYDLNIEVDEEECSKAGIDYKKRIKTHNFEKLQNYLDSLVGGLSYTSQKQEINHLLRLWNPELRYSQIELDHTQVKELYDHTTQYLKRM